MPLKKDLGQWISHFEKSDAPQFKGKSEEERKNMALAAFRAKYGSLTEAYTSATNNELAQYVATLKDELAYYKQKKDSKRIDMTKKDLADVKAELESRRAKRGSMNEASEGDAVDTITMDIPLFLRMLEFAREDASEDMDLHDVTEKANLLTKDRGILSMNDYNEIVGASEEITEAFSKEYDDDPALKGDQKKLPDALQKSIISKVKKKMEEEIVTDDPEKAEDIANKTGEKVTVVKKGSIQEGREFDYEGSMARTQLFSIIKNSKSLFDQIDDRTQLQSWVQSKLTKAEDYIDAVRTYLEGESLSTTTPLVVSEEMIKDEEGASLNIGDVVKAGDGGIYQVIFSYMEGKPFLVPFDLKKRKPTNLRNRIYFDSDSIVVKKLHKVMPFSATKGGFMK